jgi:uncharacterized protein (DUF1800 family)
MKMRKSFVLTAFAALSVAVLPAVASRTANLFHKKLDKQQRVLHALDRLTFGPRPGDVAAVRKMGLKKWIDLQLHPERIKENPELTAKLKPLDSLRMTPEEVIRHYPPQQIIAAVARGRMPMPRDPVLRATVERLVARYRSKKGLAGADPNMMAADDEPAGRPLRELLSRDDIFTLRRGTNDERAALVASWPVGRLDDILIALPKRQRNMLFQFAPTTVKRKILLLNSPEAVVNFDLDAGKLYRAIYSNRQLQEELVDFWYNHFNVFLYKGADRFLVPSYEREAIRPHVLGRFRDLLEATAKSPAMLFYLDNVQSVGVDSVANLRRPEAKRRGLNENYGRELMELHTLGVDGGYTQKDVIEVARCFTGWTIRPPRLGGGFFYNDRLHDKGAKVVLGVKIPAGGGMDDGEKVLDILAHSPATAHHVSLELAERFVADNPPPELVSRMAATFEKTDGDLRAVMKVMIDSKDFWSQGAYRAKVKTPFEMTVSAVRALDADVENTQPLAGQIARMGEPLYRKVEPNGYGNLNAEWVDSSALLDRMNFALALAQNRIPGVKVDTSRFSAAGQDPVEIAKEVMFTDVSPQTRAAIDKALAAEQGHKSKEASPALIAGLILGSPEFQRR